MGIFACHVLVSDMLVTIGRRITADTLATAYLLAEIDRLPDPRHARVLMRALDRVHARTEPDHRRDGFYALLATIEAMHRDTRKRSLAGGWQGLALVAKGCGTS